MILTPPGIHPLIWSYPTLKTADLCDQQDTVEMLEFDFSTRSLNSLWFPSCSFFLITHSVGSQLPCYEIKSSSWKVHVVKNQDLLSKASTNLTTMWGHHLGSSSSQVSNDSSQATNTMITSSEEAVIQNYHVSCSGIPVPHTLWDNNICYVWM